MARYCSTAYSLFFMSVVLATATADQCQIVLLNRCKAVYKDALDATSTPEGGHCFRLQKLAACVAGEPKCGGELIEKLRYWVLQIAMLDKILGTCVDIDYSTLKIVVQDSDVAKTHGNLDDVEFEGFEECALTVHKKCTRYYVTLLTKDHQICEGIGKLQTCYDSYSKSINCDTKIIQHFVSVVENVAHRVLHLFNDMKSFCPSSDELKIKSWNDLRYEE